MVGILPVSMRPFLVGELVQKAVGLVGIPSTTGFWWLERVVGDGWRRLETVGANHYIPVIPMGFRDSNHVQPFTPTIKPLSTTTFQPKQLFLGSLLL